MSIESKPPAQESFSPIVRATIHDMEPLLEEVLDFSRPDVRGNWYYRGDTGTGKTTAVQWHVANTTLARFVIAVPTRLAADQMYARLKSWGADVAVWTQAHDLRNPKPANFSPSGRFFKEDLPKHRIVIGTHNFLLDGKNDVDRLIGPRDLLIIDEVPLHFDGAAQLHLTDFTKAWEEANAIGCDEMVPLRRALIWAEETTEAAETRGQYHKPELNEREGEWREIAESIHHVDMTRDARMAMQYVVEFVLASFEGRAFVQLRDGGGQKRTAFCTTSMHLSSVKRAMHVSATVHLEGWQVSPYRNQVRQCRGLNLDYRNLKIVADAWPNQLPRKYQDILQSPKALEDFKQIVLDLVLKTPHDSKVLLVVPNALLEHARSALSGIKLLLLRRPLNVRLTHFKVDIGSNDYADCTDVILLGLHHAPKTAHIQRGLQFSQAEVSQQLLDEQSGRLTGIFRDIRSDDHKSQIKQLGARGRVRVANADGTCGRMRLWTYQDHVAPNEIAELFPGAVLDARPAAFRKRHGVRRDRQDLNEVVVSALTTLAPDIAEITLHALGELIGKSDLSTRGSRLAAQADVWAAIGWTFVPGTRGRSGRPARFLRLMGRSTVMVS